MPGDRSPHLDRRQYVEPHLDEATVERNWERIQAASFDTGTDLRPALGAAAVLAAAAVVVSVLLFEGEGSKTSWGGTTLESGKDPISVTLADSSTIRAGAETRIELIERTTSETRLSLIRGEAEFEVKRDPKRHFIVEAGSVTVRVIGTRFKVKTGTEGGATAVTVSVTKGIVEVRTGRGTRRLRRGERYHLVEELTTLADGDEPNATEAHDPGEATPGIQRETGARPTPKPRPSSKHVTPESASPELKPKALFDAARTAKRAGKHREAADAYASFLAQFPSDSRTSLAAFELGRIRMDILGDLPGAVAAFNEALRLSPGGTFREDAMARRVRVYARMGDTTGCQRARAEYLTAYPSGHHRAGVVSSCTP